MRLIRRPQRPKTRPNSGSYGGGPETAAARSRRASRGRAFWGTLAADGGRASGTPGGRLAMQIISTLSLFAAAALAALVALGRLHYPVTVGTTTFDGALALVAAICLLHALARMRRRGPMGSLRFGTGR